MQRAVAVLSRVVLTLVVAAAVAAGCGGDDPPSGAGDETTTSSGMPGHMGESHNAAPTVVPPAIDGVVQFSGLARDHVQGPVDYEQTPPVGGPHADVWQDCGFYSQPIITEQGVHSMEHGAVWITFRSDLDPAGQTALETLADQPYVLLSPWPGADLPSPVVASAWGLQLRADGGDDPRLARFVAEYANGPQTPEPGAPCTGGDGQSAQPF